MSPNVYFLFQPLSKHRLRHFMSIAGLLDCCLRCRRFCRNRRKNQFTLLVKPEETEPGQSPIIDEFVLLTLNCMCSTIASMHNVLPGRDNSWMSLEGASD